MSPEIARLFADGRLIRIETEQALNEAWNSFDYDGRTIDRWDNCEDLLLRFDWQVQQCLLGITPRTAYPEGHVQAFLRQYRGHVIAAFGASGLNACFERIRNGVDGGVAAVLREFGEYLADEAAKTRIGCMVSAYWDRLTIEQKLAAPLAFIADYSSILPPGLIEGSAARIRANFPEFLKLHMQLARKLERIGHE